MSFLSYSKHFQGPADIMLRDPARYLAFAQLLHSVMSAVCVANCCYAASSN